MRSLQKYSVPEGTNQHYMLFFYIISINIICFGVTEQVNFDLNRGQTRITSRKMGKKSCDNEENQPFESEFKRG